jgi:transposase
MNKPIINTDQVIWVAMDIAKRKNDVLIEWPDGKQKKLKINNIQQDYRKFIGYLLSFKLPCVAGLEATSNYHRPIAYWLQQASFTVKLISSFAACKTREALHNSWDKNDPKDTRVILHLLKTGVVQTYYDPLINQCNDIQEISKTYKQISLRKVRVQHSIMNHYLPLYFPEVEKYFHSSRALWFSSFLSHFPTPNTVTQYSFDEFEEAAWKISGRKVNKKSWLLDFYQTAQQSIGLPVDNNSQAVAMFRTILKEHQELCQLMVTIETTAKNFLGNNQDYGFLQSIPGIGPIIALTVLAEAGDLRRFNHYRQFLKFCGFDLSTHQSGRFRGQSKLSKFGNARLRYAFWIAGTVAIRMRENTFRKKFENYIKNDPLDADLKRKGYSAVAAKMARVAYGVVKHQTNYRCYYENR